MDLNSKQNRRKIKCSKYNIILINPKNYITHNHYQI
jgi:hypothetical protein